MNSVKEIPVLLLTGYLGSGKTTLVNHILSNERGIKFAVIVNDIGEVNIDADLIQQGGVVGKKDDSLVALQNGCICCTLKADLIEQIFELMKLQRFDYIVIEASGICEPEPIAQTICSIPTLGGAYVKYGKCRLDSIVTVVDALRLQDEFSCGDTLTRPNIDEEDIENLIIQQIEFCNIILLNKASEVQPEERKRIKQIIRTLQPQAEIIECDYAKVELDKLLDTQLFDFERVATSAGWVREIERQATAEEEREARASLHHHHHHHDKEEHEHAKEGYEHAKEGVEHHHHHHHAEGGEVFVATQWPKNVIRTKGVCYFSHNRDMSFLFEQAGRQKQIKEAGLWYATAPDEDLIELMRQEPGLLRDWDERYGDRMIKLVFIGQHLDKAALTKALDGCLE